MAELIFGFMENVDTVPLLNLGSNLHKTYRTFRMAFSGPIASIVWTGLMLVSIESKFYSSLPFPFFPTRRKVVFAAVGKLKGRWRAVYFYRVGVRPEKKNNDPSEIPLFLTVLWILIGFSADPRHPAPGLWRLKKKCCTILQLEKINFFSNHQLQFIYP